MAVFVVTHKRGGLVVSRLRAVHVVADSVESAVALAGAVAGDGIVDVQPTASSSASTGASGTRPLINLAVLADVRIGAAARGRPLRADMNRSWLSGSGRVAHRCCGAAKLESWPKQHVSYDGQLLVLHIPWDR
jgi:hypothetical protein